MWLACLVVGIGGSYRITSKETTELASGGQIALASVRARAPLGSETRVGWLGYASRLSLIGATLRAWRFGARFSPEKFWHWVFSLRSVID